MGEIDNINRLKRAAVSEDNRPENTPTVSIIIPVYNVAPFLREALDSVVNQTYKVLQILIIDDGSTDGSSQICDEYKKIPALLLSTRKTGELALQGMQASTQPQANTSHGSTQTMHMIHFSLRNSYRA